MTLPPVEPPGGVRIIDLEASNEGLVGEVAQLLLDGFRVHSPGWFDGLDDALDEVHESFDEDRISRVAVDASGSAVGFIGGIKQYDGLTWELHPLVVREDARLRGLGRALVRDLELRVVARGGESMWLGTDDEDGRTSLSAVDLYDDPLGHLGRIENPGWHPFEFYQRVGYSIVGVLPDANGPGRPDIFLARRLVPREASKAP
ncbi:MAG: GNAT family N-acetyltransferase [Dehalococcoidia bacterium]